MCVVLWNIWNRIHLKWQRQRCSSSIPVRTKGLSNRFCAHKDIWRAGCMVFGKDMMQNSYNHIISPAGVTQLHFVVTQLKEQQQQLQVSWFQCSWHLIVVASPLFSLQQSIWIRPNCRLKWHSWRLWLSSCRSSSSSSSSSSRRSSSSWAEFSSIDIWSLLQQQHPLLTASTHLSQILGMLEWHFWILWEHTTQVEKV